jgi:cytochrome oxidase Cu insertion factor (SCO1/SenC/PrrC family)
MNAQAAGVPRRTSARNRRLLVLLAAIGLAPVVLSYTAYYFWPRDARANYGALIESRTLSPIAGLRLDGTPFDAAPLQGRWIILYAGAGACPPPCTSALYASRQARTIQNAERERIARVWLVDDAAEPSATLLAQHPDLAVVRVDARTVVELPLGSDRIYVIDPLGNFVLAWPSNPDIKAMAKDLGRLLRASSIG